MSNTEDDMDKPVTKRELHEALEVWGGALEARLDAKLENSRKLLSAELVQSEKRLSAELAQHTNRILDTVKEIVAPVDQ